MAVRYNLKMMTHDGNGIVAVFEDPDIYQVAPTRGKPFLIQFRNNNIASFTWCSLSRIPLPLIKVLIDVTSSITSSTLIP